MDWLFKSMTEGVLYEWEQLLGDWFFLFSIAFLSIELIRYYVQKRLKWALVGDTVTNFVTQAFFLGLSLIFLYVFNLSALSFFHQFALFDIAINWATVFVCVVLADLMYYWEHRFSHRVAIAWATHTVHHSSPHFNISVAYRFGPLDALWAVFFHIPLVVLGFNPFQVVLAEVIVLLYQTVLHTEVIGKLPRPIEAVMNTPSHHRVHHGRNDRYIDKNYAGMFILWDRMFGTFAEETEAVTFGITEPVNSINPFVVFFHGFARLWRDFWHTGKLTSRLVLLVRPPGWQPKAPKFDSIVRSSGNT